MNSNQAIILRIQVLNHRHFESGSGHIKDGKCPNCETVKKLKGLLK